MKNLFRTALLAALLFGISSMSAATAASRALLIGIASYKSLPSLENPKVDVVKAAEKLKAAGYQVTMIMDPQTDRLTLLNKFDTFLNSIKAGDEVVIYYSGHGVDIDGNNMFVPSDSPAGRDIRSQFALAQRLIPMQPLMKQIEDREPGIQVWIVDACRENPFDRTGKPFLNTGGLTRFPERPNSFVILAANYGQIAKDTLSTEPKDAKLGSPFSRSFFKLFDNWKSKSVSAFALQLRREVMTLVNPDPQFPVFWDGTTDQWCFVKCSDGVEFASVTGTVSRPPESVATIKDFNGITSIQFNSSRGDSGSADLAYGKLFGKEATVFIGKESQAGCKLTNVSDLYPFGCAVLRRLSAHFNLNSSDPAAGMVGQLLEATTSVNVRQGLPTTGTKGEKFGCIIKTLNPGSAIKVKSTVALRYAGDVFYWGIIDGSPSECARKD